MSKLEIKVMNEEINVNSKNAPIVPVNRSVLKELNKNKEHSPLNSKSPVGPVGNKTLMTTTNTTTTISSPQHTMPNSVVAASHSRETTPVAGTANLQDSSLLIKSSHGENSSANNLSFFDTSVSKRLSTKFVGLTEFDEADIPELPDSLDPDFCEDPLKLTFDENLLPTFMVEANENLDNFKADSTNEIAFLQLPNTEPETALSSDNEIYAECQSYRDSELNYEDNLDISDVEHFESAFNTHENTLNDDQLHETFEDLTEATLNQPFINRDTLTLQTRDIGSTTPIAASIENDYEPMDVDMNSTLEMSNSSNNTTIESEQVLYKKILQQNEIIPENVEQIGDGLKQHMDTLTKLNEAAYVKGDLPKEANLQTNQTPIENSVLKTLEFPLNCNVGEKAQPTTVDVQHDMGIFSNVNVPETVETIPTMNVTTNVSPKNIVKNDFPNLVLTLNTNVLKSQIETSPQKSPSNFPLKQAAGDASKFPTTPEKTTDKQMPFIEISAYTESLNKNSLSNLNCEDQTLDAHVLGELQRTISTATTVSVSSINSFNATFDDNMKISPNEKNATFDNNVSVPNTSCASEDLKHSLIRRRTFNLDLSPSSPNSEQSENTAQVINSSRNSLSTSNDDKRRTFNLPSPDDQPKTPTTITVESSCSSNKEILEKVENNEKSNSIATTTVFPLSAIATEQLKHLEESYEAMDIDESFTVPNVETPNKVPKSPPLPAHRVKQPVLEPASLKGLTPSPPPTQSSPLSNMFNRPTICSAASAAAAKILSQSPPLSSRDTDEQNFKMPPPIKSPLAAKKRSSFNTVLAKPPAETLSSKEQTKSDAKDEKDIFVEKFNSSTMDDIFDTPTGASNPFSSNAVSQIFNTEQFKNEFSHADAVNSNLILQQSDFDFLLTKGSPNAPIDRSSLLLRFDPLLGVPVPVNNTQQHQQTLQQILQKANNVGVGGGLGFGGISGTRLDYYSENNCLKSSAIIEEEPLIYTATTSSTTTTTKTTATSTTPTPTQVEVQAQVQVEVEVQGDNKNCPATSATITNCAKITAKTTKEEEQQRQQQQQQQQNRQQQQLQKQILKPEIATTKKHANMSVDVIKDINIDNDCTKNNYEHLNLQSDEKEGNYKMDELEKKIKNEVLKTEDIEKKLKEAELREEALIKRITEKDKTMSKMSGVIEAYEKAIAEVIAEKEQLAQNFERQLSEISADRDSNYRHLTSLETTFSDLHVKYEKSKEMTSQLKASEESLLADKRKILENLRKQEQRYEKMKNHAMQQLDIANKKLETMKKEYAIETTKLKAQLKKEEISRASINEQLQQKTRENEELVKICDELINGQGS